MASAFGFGGVNSHVREGCFEVAQSLVFRQKQLAIRSQDVFERIKHNRGDFDAILQAFQLIVEDDALQEDVIGYSVTLA